MGLRERLHRLTGEQSPEEAAKGSAETLNRLRQRVEAILARGPEGRKPMIHPGGSSAPIEETVPGEEIVTREGSFFCVHRVQRGSCRHGGRCIRDMAPLDMTLLAVLANDPALAAFDYEEALFLDTETTGLSGGTGAVPFLIGLGWFEGGSFVTRQIFARDYSEEKAVLSCLIDTARGKKFLISFNGKGFDVHLLTTRFIMNRLENPLAGLPHVDLLHAARRLLRHRLTDRRLGILEEALLGVQRDGDIPGFEIPRRYFDWLRQRDGRLMAAVFEHNRLDILSLAALAAHLVDLIDPGENRSTHPDEDRLAAGRLFLGRGLHGDAVRLLDPLRCSARTETAWEAQRELSLLYRRSARWTAAVRLWEDMIQQDAGDVFALVELAKWYEHRAHDLPRAAALTRQALDRGTFETPCGIKRVDLLHRLRRIEERLQSGRTVTGV